MKNWDEILVVSMQLSLNPRALIAKGPYRLFPQPYARNPRPSLYALPCSELQKANVVGDDLMSALSKRRRQRRLAGAGLPDKRDNTIRNVDGRRVKRCNSPLMAQHAERTTKEIRTKLTLVRPRRWIYHDLIA
jgi:hypothetical protein